MVKALNIEGHIVGPGNPCFIIAEAGVNHNGSLEMALRLVDAAHSAGADAVKFQLYHATEQVSKTALTADYQRNQTGSETMLEMAQSYDLPWNDHRTIASHCAKSGILYMASCFDPMAVDFLLDLGGRAVKIGSGEITNFPLLAHLAKKNVSILLSTGMSTLSDIAQAVEHVQRIGNSPLALFQCVSNYPTDPATVNLRVIQTLACAFAVPVGFSDHTLGNGAAIAAVALGVNLLEKHFTLDKTLTGPDHAMSLDPDELRRYIADIRMIESAMGNGVKSIQPGESEVQRAARRSLVSAQQIEEGEILTESNVTLKRPATGIDPRLWGRVKGRAVKSKIPADVPITWEALR